MSTANEATTAAPRTTCHPMCDCSVTTAAAQKPVKGGLRPPVADTDFKEKYPPDRELGHELDDTARVWKVYRGEAIDHDDALLKTWNETVNILLTFAGLFSAAVTSFVVASTDDLKPDPNAYVANLLFALGNATAASAFAHLPAPPPLEAAPTSLARVVNGLWFTSLFLSLAAALLCILVKQWLDEYTARTRGSAKHPHEWARRRSFYFQGLTDWNVAAIISFLPLFLHLALFLFLAGLTAFLWDLDSSIRLVMLVLVSLLLAFYVLSLFLPVWSAACPYATPLLAQLRNLGYTALVGVCILRNWALTCRTAVKRLVRRVFNRAASLPTSSYSTHTERSERDAHVSDPQIKLLLERRSRRPFDRVLAKASSVKKYTLTSNLDCSSLQWLMHDVSDSDAVAVAWQSLGAFLEEPQSLRLTRMHTIMMELVQHAGGHMALWKTVRMDGLLDDLQLGRITRSALFIAFSMHYGLRDIASYGVPYFDQDYVANTLSPDAALIYALTHPTEKQADHVVKVIHRLHEQGTHRPLPSTAMFLIPQLSSYRYNTSSEAAIGLLHYCDPNALSWKTWALLATIMGLSNHGHDPCGVACVVNDLCTRALKLIEDEASGGSNAHQNSAAPLDAYFHVQLVIRILSAVSEHDLFAGTARSMLSDAVWTVLTDTRHFSRGIQREDRVRAVDWARALCRLAQRSDRLYASFATQYNSTWSMLLHRFVRNHSTVIFDGDIDFDGGAASALFSLENALGYVTAWRITFTDPALRPAMLRSALALAESASIAFCSVDFDPWYPVIPSFVSEIPLLALFPTDLTLTEEEHNDWVELFISTAQHLLVLDPLPWNNLRDAVAASTDNDVKSFFNEVQARLTDLGPCQKGACASKAPTDSDWLSALGPTL